MRHWAFHFALRLAGSTTSNAKGGVQIRGGGEWANLKASGLPSREQEKLHCGAANDSWAGCQMLSGDDTTIRWVRGHKLSDFEKFRSEALKDDPLLLLNLGTDDVFATTPGGNVSHGVSNRRHQHGCLTLLHLSLCGRLRPRACTRHGARSG